MVLRTLKKVLDFRYIKNKRIKKIKRKIIINFQ